MLYKKIVSSEELEEVEKLYIDSFDAVERVDFQDLFRGVFKNFQLVGQYDAGKLVGMMHYIVTPDYVHLNYFAISRLMRGKGYGTKCLNWLKNEYPNMPIVVDVEELDEMSANNDYRKLRQRFYASNGFEKSGCTFWWEGVFMTYLHFKNINEEKFLKHITHVFPTIKDIKIERLP